MADAASPIPRDAPRSPLFEFAAALVKAQVASYRAIETLRARVTAGFDDPNCRANATAALAELCQMARTP
jgi:hypothetical protein